MKKISAFLCVLTMIFTCISGGTTAFATTSNKVLSGNKLSDTGVDKEYKTAGVIQTNASYEWTADSDAELKTNDRANAKMTSGSCDVTTAEVVTNTAWDAPGTSTIIFNLGRTYKVNQVDVWSVNTANDKMGNFTVSTSVDGVSYTEKGTGTGDAAQPSVYKTTATLTSSEAQYVKITIYKGAGYKMVIGEVLVLGDEAADPKAGLRDKIKEAEKYTAAGLSEVYSSVTYNALTTAIATANGVIGNAGATSGDITNAITALDSAIKGLQYNFAKNVLSSNKLDTGSGYPEVFKNNSTYAFKSGHKDIINNPNVSTLLTDGRIAEGDTAGEALLWGGWDDGTPAVAEFDLKGQFYITDVDVYSLFDPAPKFMGEFDVELSTNGVDFTRIFTAKSPEHTGGAKLVKTHGECIPQKASHVRITMKNGAGSHQMVLGEAVIQGLSTMVDKSALLTEINSAKALDKTIFTIATWENVEKSLATATTVYKDENATATQVENAITAIKTAVGGLKYLYDTKVISDNALSPTEIETLYPMGIEQTNVVYEWLTGSDVDIIKNDSTCIKMKSGGVKETAGELMTFGAWDGIRVATAKYTFPNECYINQVDVWSKLSTSNVRMAGFDVEVSMDGNTYTKVATVQNPLKYADVKAEGIVNTVAKFPAVKAKYLKVTMSANMEGADYSNQLVLGEIVIEGFKAPFVAPIQFDIFDLQYTDGNYVPINKLSSLSDTLMVTGEVFNNSDGNKNVTAISVLYNENGQMVKMGTHDINAIKGARTPFEINVTGLPSGITDAYTLKTYVWSSLNECVPLTRIKTFGEI
ncbi:MAG: discoidin domain-containing protein [Oscillospiraceae bacterium]